MPSASRNPGSISGVKRSAKVRSLTACLASDWLMSATRCMSHLFLSPAGWFVADAASSGDLFLFDQTQVAADVKAEMTGEEACHALDVQGPVGEIGPGVRRALHDPDLARPA